MLFKVGDKILFKKSKGGGTILRINSPYKVLIETFDGLEINISTKEIVKIDANTDRSIAYGNNIYKKDNKSKTRKILKKQQKTQTVLKLDLHIDLLLEEYNHLSNFEIVQIQLDMCKKNIEYILNSHITKLIIVHGIGAGVLKGEVHKLLEDYKLRYYISQDGGTTEVIL